MAAWDGMLDEYEAHLRLDRGLSPHTARAYLTDLRSLAAHSPDPAAITLTRLRQWLAGLVDDGLASSTIQRRVACVRGFFAWADEEGHLDGNPAVRLRAPKRHRALPKVISEPAVSDVMAAAATRSGEEGEATAVRDEAIVETLYSCGLRVSELTGMRLSDLDLDTRTVRVLGKGGKERVLPLGKPAAEALRRWLARRS